MKRFLRYFVYRELYRVVREAANSEGDKPEERRRPPEEVRLPRRVDRESLEGADLRTTVGLMQQIDPYDFEELVAELWELKGWETEVSSGGADRGVDVVARKEFPYEQKTLIQVKRYGPNTTVGSPEIQQYASLRQQRGGVDKAVVVTSNEFTGQAREMARKLNVKLVDGYSLAQMVEALEAHDLLARYLEVEVVEPDEGAGREGGAGESETESTAEPPGADEPGRASGASDGRAAREASAEASEAVESIAASPAWYYGVWLALAGWVTVIYGVERFDDDLWAVLFFTSWLVLPLTVYYDASRLKRELDWPRRPWLYAVGSAVWFANLVVCAYYLALRHSKSRETETGAGD